jgi:hypothetical protein
MKLKKSDMMCHRPFMLRQTQHERSMAHYSLSGLQKPVRPELVEGCTGFWIALANY